MRIRSALLFSFALVALSIPVRFSHALAPGEAAPDFSATDSNGKTQTLSKMKGKFVVLEWFNQGCPYVKKHYDSGNMQKLQKQYTGKDVVWWTILSSAPGKQGYETAAEANATMKEKGAASSAVLLDPEGKIGKLYQAKTTPHLFVIDPKGSLIYMGAIDDKASTDVADLSGATNYVSQALDAAMAGKPVVNAATVPYGCSVKYQE